MNVVGILPRPTTRKVIVAVGEQAMENTSSLFPRLPVPWSFIRVCIGIDQDKESTFGGHSEGSKERYRKGLYLATDASASIQPQYVVLKT